MFEGPNSFGLPPKKVPGSILRKQVGERDLDQVLNSRRHVTLCS